ncbi:hypothetical protein ANANG_G00084540, partial [Anguilla anguilla]
MTHMLHGSAAWAPAGREGKRQNHFAADSHHHQKMEWTVSRFTLSPPPASTAQEAEQGWLANVTFLWPIWWVAKGPDHFGCMQF